MEEAEWAARRLEIQRQAAAARQERKRKRALTELEGRAQVLTRSFFVEGPGLLYDITLPAMSASACNLWCS